MNKLMDCAAYMMRNTIAYIKWEINNALYVLAVDLFDYDGPEPDDNGF